MSNIIRVGNGTALSIPFLICHIRMRGVVARGDIAAADAVLVEECPVGVKRMRFFCRNGGVCVHLSAAALFGIPTIKVISGTNWRRHFAVGTIMLYGLCLVACI